MLGILSYSKSQGAIASNRAFFLAFHEHTIDEKNFVILQMKQVQPMLSVPVRK